MDGFGRWVGWIYEREREREREREEKAEEEGEESRIGECNHMGSLFEMRG